MEEQIQKKSFLGFNNIFEYCLLALVFFVPVIFVPSLAVSLYVSKITLIATIIVFFLAAFLASTLSKGLIVIPKSRFLIPIVVFPFVALLSSFFSGQLLKSIAGDVFEIGTTGSLFILVALLFLTILSIKEEVTVGIKAIYAFILSAIVILVHLFVRSFAVGLLPTALLGRIPNFLVGGSVDTAIFLGAMIIVALSTLNMLELSKRSRYVIYALLVLSVVFIGAIGFLPAIIVIGLFSLIYFVYTFSWSVNSQDSLIAKGNSSSFPSLFVLAISVVLVLSGGSLSGFLANIFNLNSIEVRPNINVTLSMVGEALKQNAALGVGPNMFKELWDLKKPQDINSTQFWSADFNFGSGFIPTMAATSGVLGIISILVFLALYVHTGFKAIFSLGNDVRFRYLAITSFFVSLFLWVMAFVYVPSISILALTFIFTGIFAATLVPQGVVQNIEINIFRNPKANFFSVFLIVVLLIASIAFGYFVWERSVAASFFQRGKTREALNLVSSDLYWRSFSEISVARVGSIVAAIPQGANLDETGRVAVQGAIADSVESARRAIEANSKNYQNWFVLGRVYEILASNGIEGATESARAAYIEAQKRSPLNPAIPLAFSRLSALSGDLNGARENIAAAINLKNNYTDAYFTLAQLEVATNNIEGAIRSVEAAALLDSQNAALYFQLGLLKYNNRDYRGAAAAFEQAVNLIPDYANARYFLGLAYSRLNRDNEAIIQFENIQKTNPDNQEINLILSNLKAGKSPFANAEPPIDDKPEKRDKPPIKEN